MTAYDLARRWVRGAPDPLLDAYLRGESLTGSHGLECSDHLFSSPCNRDKHRQVFPGRVIGVSAASLLACVVITSCGENDPTIDTGPVVSRTERVWVDTTRVTPRTSAYAGAPSRSLRVLIWAPAESQALPLLVMAHGNGGLPEKFDAFAHTIAAGGFVVAALAFPLTNEDAPGGNDAGFRDVVNQPGDVSFVITQLLAAAARSGDPLQGRIAAHDIALLGHSLGAVTAIAVTRADCCRDPRVTASIIVSVPLPIVTAIHGAGAVAAHGPPTLILHGMADRTVEYSNAPLLYDMIDPPRILVGLPGAGHSELLESQTEPAIVARATAQRATLAFLNATFRGEDAELTQTLASLATAGSDVREDVGS